MAIGYDTAKSYDSGLYTFDGVLVSSIVYPEVENVTFRMDDRVTFVTEQRVAFRTFDRVAVP